MNENLELSNDDPITADELACLLKLNERFKASSLRFPKTQDNEMELLHTGASVAICDGQPLIKAKLTYPDWLDEDPYAIAAVIQTTAIVNGKALTETVYACILDATDVDDSGDEIYIGVVPMAEKNPLLDMLPLRLEKLLPDVQGLLIQKNIWGKRRAILGISVHLGRIANTPTPGND